MKIKVIKIVTWILIMVIATMTVSSCKKNMGSDTQTESESTVSGTETTAENTEPSDTPADEPTKITAAEIILQALPDGIGGYTVSICSDDPDIVRIRDTFAGIDDVKDIGVSVSDVRAESGRTIVVERKNVASGSFDASYENEVLCIGYSDSIGMLRAINCLLSTEHNGTAVAVALASQLKGTMPQLYQSQPKTANIFSGNMLFQQNKPFTVTGTSDVFSEVMVRLTDNGRIVSEEHVTTASDGTFSVTLPAVSGSYTEYNLEIFGDYSPTSTLRDIVFGELWISAGQSNMEYTLSADADGRELELNDKYIRALYSVREVYPYEPQSDYEKCIWLTAANGYIKSTSAVAYFFSAVLREKLDVPVGYINCAVGGSAIREWLSRDTINGNDALYSFYIENDMYVTKSDWNESKHAQMSACYNLRMAPVTVFETAGVIWYQGEADISSGNYTMQMEALHDQLCKDFGFENGDIPLIYVTIAPYIYSGITQSEFAAYQLELARFALEHPSFSSVIANYDVSPEFDYTNSPIHPRTKKPIGTRMALSALGLVYDFTEYGATSSPVLMSSEVRGDSVYMRFSNVGSGLSVIDGGDELKGFLICGENGVFETADAEIVSQDTVRVFSDFVSSPTGASYAYYSSAYSANLCSTFNGEKLFPALPAITIGGSDLKYTSYLDWADCDLQTRFHVKPGNADISKYYPTWRTGTLNSADVQLGIDNDVKFGGSGSLAVTYSCDNDALISVTPVLDAESRGMYYLFGDTETSFSQFAYLRFYAAMPDNVSFVSVVFTDTDGEKYTASSFSSRSVGDFELISVDLGNLTAADGGEANGNVLQNICSVEFVFGVYGTSGTLYIDNISFGTDQGI